MDYIKLTAPCGRDCFNCDFHLASLSDRYKHGLAKKIGLEPEKVTCKGCREIDGNCQILKNYGFNGDCKIHHCVKAHDVEFCNECSDFPCDLLHPLKHGSDKFPHNLKVYNLCMIEKMGLENWAKNKSKQSWDRYLNDKLDTCV